jgi:tetratricopeptide (TPR) repeat protein
MSQGDFPRAVTLLEDAYDNGFDVAELHAMLAYARFVASGQDMQTAKHAFELLDYAQNMDPSLDLVHAYRGAIYQALDDPQRAREALDRALELNPYCEFAMEVMDQLG